MKIQSIDSTQEKQILTAMVVDRLVLAKLSGRWQTEGMFKNDYANMIANWCIDYFEKYQKAPMGNIEKLFELWAQKHKDKNTVSLIEKFLFTLSNDYKKLKKSSNSDYIIDLCGKYFNQIKLEKLNESIQEDIDSGKIERAIGKVYEFNKIEIGKGEGVNVLQDTKAIQEAFEDKAEPLITYTGALGKFFGDSLERDGFINFIAPEKRGKSMWLIDVAFRAILQRRKVALFSCGDMSQHQIMRRMMIRVAGQPLKNKEVQYPKSIVKYKECEVDVKHKEKKFDTMLSWQQAVKKCNEMMKEKIKSKRPLLKLSCHPSSTLKVKDIIGIIKGWERTGWVPDVIVIDYADILNMDYFGLTGRDKINETWKQLRALSQMYHCLVVTATQADAASYEKQTIGMSNFSDDKRKRGHVTGEIGINQTPTEKSLGVYRLNWTVRREDEYNIDNCVYVAGCLRLCNPAVKSCFEQGDDK